MKNNIRILITITAVILSACFIVSHMTGAVTSVRANDDVISEEASGETSELTVGAGSAEAPLFAVVDGVLYVRPGVTVEELLKGLDGAVGLKGEKDEDTSSEEASSEEASAEVSSDETQSEENASEAEKEDAAALLVGTGMTVLFEDGSELTAVVKGDVDGDGLITAADARAALRIAVRLDTPTAAQENACLVKQFIDASAQEDDADSAADTEETTAEAEETATGEKEEASSETSEETVTAVTPADARAILRAAVSLESAEDWFLKTAAGDGTAEEPTSGEAESSEETSSEEASSEETGSEETSSEESSSEESSSEESSSEESSSEESSSEESSSEESSSEEPEAE